MDSKVDKMYKKIINNDNIIIFGLSHCAYTQKAIELLKKYKISYKYYSIDKYYNLFFETLHKVSNLYPNLDIDTNHKTIPVIFIKKKFIGGFTELDKIINTNSHL